MVIGGSSDADRHRCHIDVAPFQSQTFSQPHAGKIRKGARHVDGMAWREFFKDSADYIRCKNSRRFGSSATWGQRDVIHRIMQQVTAISDGPSQGRVKTTQLVF